jgi:hypothetical protein
MTAQPYAAIDRRVLEALKHVHNCGAELYNSGAHAEAFRLYQGGLFVVRGFLDHRPAVRRGIEDGLAEVEAVDGNVRLRAFHEVIEQVRSDLKAIWIAAAPAQSPETGAGAAPDAPS